MLFHLMTDFVPDPYFCYIPAVIKWMSLLLLLLAFSKTTEPKIVVFVAKKASGLPSFK